MLYCCLPPGGEGECVAIASVVIAVVSVEKKGPVILETATSCFFPGGVWVRKSSDTETEYLLKTFAQPLTLAFDSWPHLHREIVNTHQEMGPQSQQEVMASQT